MEGQKTEARLIKALYFFNFWNKKGNHPHKSQQATNTKKEKYRRNKRWKIIILISHTPAFDIEPNIAGKTMYTPKTYKRRPHQTGKIDNSLYPKYAGVFSVEIQKPSSSNKRQEKDKNYKKCSFELERGSVLNQKNPGKEPRKNSQKEQTKNVKIR